MIDNELRRLGIYTDVCPACGEKYHFLGDDTCVNVCGFAPEADFEAYVCSLECANKMIVDKVAKLNAEGGDFDEGWIFDNFSCRGEDGKHAILPCYGDNHEELMHEIEERLAGRGFQRWRR